MKAMLKTVARQGLEDYQFLQRSILPTLHFQKSLPRLPIPNLEDTCVRFLRGVFPLLDQHQFNLAQNAVEEFKEKDGFKLHTALLANDKMNKQTSFISEPWFDMYLKYRGSICVKHNPFMAFANEPDSAYNNQLIRASNLVISALRFKRSLDINRLKPEIYDVTLGTKDSKLFNYVCRVLPPSVSWYGAYLFKSFPLDMSQYQNLFNSTRIPALQKDRIVRDPTGKHILVIRKGRLYSVTVLQKDGSIYAPDELFSALNKVVSDCDAFGDVEFPVPVLTAEDRDTWSVARTHLMAAGNEEQLSAIDNALFVLCLDDLNSSDPITVSKSLLHGDGKNRWFDKSFQLVIQGSGLAALNFEHSWGDGVAVLRLMEEIFSDSQKHWVEKDAKPKSIDDDIVKEIKFKLTDESKAAISRAQQRFTAMSDRVCFNVMEFFDLTKGEIKKAQLSPDAVMQLAIQMAYYHLHQNTVATYESCSTAAFKHGRTETVRPATKETKLFVSQLHNPSYPGHRQMRLILDSCSRMHSLLTREAAMGKGCDRHLFALKHLAEVQGLPTPHFFEDESYLISNNILLSTSTLSTDTVMLGGFGPQSPNCYGIGYNVGDNRIGATVSTFKGSETNGQQFVDALSSALNIIKNLLEATKITKG